MNVVEVAVDELEVVEHEHGRRESGGLVDQQRDDHLGQADATQIAAEARVHRGQRLEHEHPEAHGVRVAWSSESHANGRCSSADACHSASSVVLPAPAGAEISVNRVPSYTHSGSTRARRAIIPAAGDWGRGAS